MGERLTNLSAEELERFQILTPRIFSDYRSPIRGPLQMLYVYGETVDNDSSTLLRAIELAKAGAMTSIGISGGDAADGYAGFDETVSRLKMLGWKSDMPIRKLGNGGNANTLTEARALVAHALAVGGDIGIVAPAFHLVRAFVTTVTAIGEHAIRAYATVGTPLRWNKHVVHSQGVVRDTRSGLLKGELQRLEKYRAPECGSLYSAEQVLEYLEWRGG